MPISPFLLERFFERYEFEVPYLLCASDCQTRSIGELLESDPRHVQKFLDLPLGYTDTKGHPDLRERISSLYLHQNQSSILVCSGAEEGIFLFGQALLRPGDHVIVHHPAYQSLREVPASIGCDVTLWRTSPLDGWRLDPQFLADQIRPNTRAVMINSPHNPTGYQISKNDWNEILEISRRHRLYLFSDEVYRGLEYSEEDRLPAAADGYERGISLGVMSKSFGLAGLRIGWLVIPDGELYRSVAQIKDYTTICNAAPSEFLAARALEKRESIWRENRSLIARNLDLLRRFFGDHEDLFSWVEPRAGCIAFPQWRQWEEGRDLYEELIRDQGILLVPGTCFDFPASFFRIGFGRDTFASGLERFGRFLHTF